MRGFAILAPDLQTRQQPHKGGLEAVFLKTSRLFDSQDRERIIATFA